MLTTKQMYEGTKTVTRRMGWKFLKAGDIVLAVEKGMGLKKGEKSVPIYPIEIVSVQEQPLAIITQADVINEGFPDKDPKWFIDMFCKSHKGCTEHSLVTRIQFKKYEPTTIQKIFNKQLEDQMKQPSLFEQKLKIN